MRVIYNCLFYLLLPFLLIRLYLRSKKNPGYRKRWSERLGFPPIKLKQSIWIHAVSVGETIAAIPLIKQIQTTYPDLPIVITNMTPTGSARVQATFANHVYNTYIPYDIAFFMRRFLKRINPKIAIIMETELWPNLLNQCNRLRIPTLLTNARLSNKSANAYKRIYKFTKQMLNQIHCIAAQTTQDAKRFISLGASPHTIHVTGNLKFDINPPASLTQIAITLRQQLGNTRYIWIAASTHHTEEQIILAAHEAILKSIPDALLILVPRHPERFDLVANLIETHKFTYVRRSQNPNVTPNTQVYLGDTMGELMALFAVSDVVFVGGSFANIGGHNILEPGVLGKPIITGPVLFNFEEISRLMLQAKGLMIAKNVTALADYVVDLFQDEEKRIQMGEAAFLVVKQNRGAVTKQLDLVNQLLASEKAKHLPPHTQVT